MTADATDSQDSIRDHVLGRPARTIDTEQIRVFVTESGAHVNEIVRKRCDEVNPLWIQSRPTTDSDQFDPAIRGTIYGADYEARLISGLVGHNLCFPFWGIRQRTRMTVHGETNIARWRGCLAVRPLLTIAAT